MVKSNNNCDISTSLPLRLEKVKTSLKEKHDLLWTDFLVLCALAAL